MEYESHLLSFHPIIKRSLANALSFDLSGLNKLAQRALNGAEAQRRAKLNNIPFRELPDLSQGRFSDDFNSRQLFLNNGEPVLKILVCRQDRPKQILDERNNIFAALMPAVLRTPKSIVIQILVFSDLRFKGDILPTLNPLLYKSSVVSSLLILPLPSLNGCMHKKSWINIGMMISGSTSKLPMTREYSSHIFSSASGVSKGASGVKTVFV